jgi:hypothetical protein
MARPPIMPFISLFAAIASFALVPTPGPARPLECQGLNDVEFLCLSATAEDLVAIPGSDWIIVSGVLRAVNVKNGWEITLFSTDPKLDRATYPSCPGPLAGRELTERKVFAHGINLRANSGGIHTLYVVHHTGRESVEVFELDARGATPKVTWIGCAPSPEGVSGNSVAVLPNGSFALTNFLNKSLGAWAGAKGASVRAKLARGEPTGEVWEWNVGRGWSKVPGSEGDGPNGLEASPDGKWYYIAEWGAQKVVKLSRGQANPTRREISVDFHPDNLRWQRDGSLLAAGQHGSVEAILSECLTKNDCSGIATSVASIDPETLEVKELVHAYPTNEYFAAGTTGLRVGNELWVGSTYHGTRIARFRAK